MEEKVLEEILKNTFTLDSFKKRVQMLKSTTEGELYSSQKKDLKDDINSSERSERDQEWMGKFDKELIKGITTENFNEVFNFLNKFINDAKKLTVYLVFIPEQEQIREIGNWLRTNSKDPKLVFEIRIDPTLIGGCAVVYNGVYKDYSLRARIDANKDKLIEQFRAYLKQ